MRGGKRRGFGSRRRGAELLFFAACLVCLLGAGVRAAARDVRLLRHGRAVSATVARLAQDTSGKSK